MGASKFATLVSDGRLVLPNAAWLGDPLEGTTPEGRERWWASQFAAATSERERAVVEQNRSILAGFAAAFRGLYYVSCWHMNDEENPRMWREYTPSPESVAVQTTYSKLRAVLPEAVEMGMVQYMDYRTDSFPGLNMFEYVTHKDLGFSWEQELRAVAVRPLTPELDRDNFIGHYFQSNETPALRIYAPPVDLGFVEVVLLHPQATDAFADRIAQQCEQAGLSSPVRSTLVLEGGIAGGMLEEGV